MAVESELISPVSLYYNKMPPNPILITETRMLGIVARFIKASKMPASILLPKPFPEESMCPTVVSSPDCQPTFPKGPSTQIVGFQGPKTIQSMDFGTQNPTIWVLGPSGICILVNPQLQHLIM